MRVCGVLFVLIAAAALLVLRHANGGGINLRQLLWYDDSYLVNLIEERYPYLKRANEDDYVAPRDYFNFSNAFKPTSEYLAATNLERHLYEEQRALEVTTQYASFDVWHYSNERQMLELDRETNEQHCEASLGHLSKRLEDAQRDSGESLFAPGRSNMNLLRWIDSWGRPESETYYGNSYWTGSFRGCKFASSKGQASAGQNSTTESLQFRYCWAKLTAKSWPENDETIPKISFRAGICLPKTCSNLVANKQNKTILNIMHFNFSPTQKKRFNKIIHIYCLPTNQKLSDHLPAVLCLTGLGCWLCLIVFLSFVRVRRNKQQENSLVDCLKIQHNFASLAADDEPPPGSPVDLRPLAHIKLLACLLVCFGHCFIEGYTAIRSSSIPILMQNDLEGLLNTYHALGWVFKSLDLFVTVGGILTAYTILLKYPQERVGKLLELTTWTQLNLIRILKVIPLLVLVLLFNKSVFVYLSEGPFWDYGTSKLTTLGKCRLEETWLRQLFLPIVLDVLGLSGQSPYYSNCANFSWYLVATTRMFLVVPMFLYFLTRNKKPLTRLRLLLFSVALSSLWQLKDMHMQQLIYQEQLFAYGRIATNFMLYSHGESSYYSLLNRSYSFAIGLFAGFYLVEFKRNNLVKWPKWMYGNYLTLALVWHLIDFAVPILHAQTNWIPSNAILTAGTVIRTRLDALTFAIISLRMATDLAPQIMQNSNAIYKLSKLSYCVYLVHYIFLSFSLTATEKSRPDTISIQLFTLFAFVILSSFLISFPLYLTIQSPFELMLKRVIAASATAKLSTTKTATAAASRTNCRAEQKTAQRRALPFGLTRRSVESLVD